MFIREALHSDLNSVLTVERAAFGSDEEPNFVGDLLDDETAKPILSLLAFEGDQPVGHILFTKAYLKPETPLSISILAPLAVVPDYQKKGIGGKLIEKGIQLLSKSGVDLVFVLGHPEYYPRFAFKPAAKIGFEATYPIPEKNADAWMVRELKLGAIGCFNGKVICAKAMDKPEHWRE